MLPLASICSMLQGPPVHLGIVPPRSPDLDPPFPHSPGAPTVAPTPSVHASPLFLQIVVVVTALAAAAYKKHTKVIEQEQGQALQSMSGVALQAMENMRTVR